MNHMVNHVVDLLVRLKITENDSPGHLKSKEGSNVPWSQFFMNEPRGYIIRLTTKNGKVFNLQWVALKRAEHKKSRLVWLAMIFFIPIWVIDYDSVVVNFDWNTWGSAQGTAIVILFCPFDQTWCAKCVRNNIVVIIVTHHGGIEGSFSFSAYRTFVSVVLSEFTKALYRHLS